MLGNIEDFKKAIEENPFKTIKYTYGFKSKHPTTFMVDISAEKAIELAEIHFFDFKVMDNYIDFNCYSADDMF